MKHNNLLEAKLHFARLSVHKSLTKKEGEDAEIQ